MHCPIFATPLLNRKKWLVEQFFSDFQLWQTLISPLIYNHVQDLFWSPWWNAHFLIKLLTALFVSKYPNFASYKGLVNSQTNSTVCRNFDCELLLLLHLHIKDKWSFQNSNSFYFTIKFLCQCCLQFVEKKFESQRNFYL